MYVLLFLFLEANTLGENKNAVEEAKLCKLQKKNKQKKYNWIARKGDAEM